MKRLLLSLVVTLVFVCQAWAEVDLEEKNRVENFSPGYCAWCSIEMLGRHVGEKRLYDLAKNRQKESDVQEWTGTHWKPLPYVMVEYPNGVWVQERRNVGTDWGIYRKLSRLGVKFTQQWTHDYDRRLIRYAMKKDLPIAFGVKAGTFGEGRSAHALVLVEYNDEIVKFIDPNDTDEVCEKSRKWFDKNWSGWLLLVEKNE